MVSRAFFLDALEKPAWRALMTDQAEKWGKQWQDLLTHSYGDVEADRGFRARLLSDLKRKTAQNLAASSETESTDEENWSKLLTVSYVPCEPRAEFGRQLFAELRLKTKLNADAKIHASAAEAPTPEDAAMRTLLTKSYDPVAPRKEFETRLLENLKERQRATHVIRRSSRRRTLWFSGLSGVAAAAMAAFVVWLAPLDSMFAPSSSVSHSREFASLSSSSFAGADTLETASEPSPVSRMGLVPASLTVPAAADAYKAADSFAGRPYPRTARGIAMEVDDGDGWKPMDITTLVELRPGLTFRANGEKGGLGLSDGSSVFMCPDSVVAVTENGFAVRQGVASFETFEQSDEHLRLDFASRDISLEPGTQLVVSMRPGEYADGGAPAPIITVMDGGMALIRNENGIGPMFADHIYQMHEFVTPDIPGRPIGSVDRRALMRALDREVPVQATPSYAPSQMVDGGVVTGSLPIARPRGFAKQGSKWVAAGYDDQPTVRLRYLSDEYFDFANHRRDLASGLGLGGEVILDGGDGNFYEIHR